MSVYVFISLVDVLLMWVLLVVLYAFLSHFF